MKFKKYFYESYGEAPFNGNNPRYVLGQQGVDEVLSKIVEALPKTLSLKDFDDAEKKILEDLIRIDVISPDLTLDCPVFVASDKPFLKQFSDKVEFNKGNIKLK